MVAIALYCFIICIVSALTGSRILRLFGISIPIVRLSKRGGIYFITWLTARLAGVYMPMIGQIDSLIKNKKNGNI